MNNNDTIVGLKNTINPAYQYGIYLDAKEILKDNKSISIDQLKQNSVFTKIIKNTDNATKQKLYSSIQTYAGKDITEDELRAILILVDSELKKSNNDEKFVMDLRYNLNENSGIFKAYPNEKSFIQETISLFDFSQPDKSYPYMQKDGTLRYYKFK